MREKEEEREREKREGERQFVCVYVVFRERERESKRYVSSDPTSNTNLHFYPGRELDILVDLNANNVTGNVLAKKHRP